MTNVLAVNESGRVTQFDSYALQGRSLPAGRRLATPVEAYLYRQLCELVDRVATIEKRATAEKDSR